MKEVLIKEYNKNEERRFVCMISQNTKQIEKFLNNLGVFTEILFLEPQQINGLSFCIPTHGKRKEKYYRKKGKTTMEKNSYGKMKKTTMEKEKKTWRSLSKKEINNCKSRHAQR